uniref:Peroxidase n=1 Tax=Senecio squalidus TaxID=121554 RepID=Q4A3Z1_SENSQ|nr:stigma specific peroxidase precursor [Senecio squalidus]
MEVYSHLRTPIILFVVVFAALTSLALGCKVGFYQATCPRAETIVQSVVKSAIRSNPTYAPGILRLFFHDCFVNGCDASVLLDGSTSEQTASTNSHLRGFEVISAAKARVETECPGVVSCADILALAARDSVVETGLPRWEVPTGRRDGLVSRAEDALKLPGSRDSAEVQIEKFAAKGLNIEELVTLVGGHTIGTSACARFVHRLYNYSNTNAPDPHIDQAFLPNLQTLCPEHGDRTIRVDLDTGSVNNFDTSYYENLRKGRGVLESDTKLWTHHITQNLVQQFISVGRPNQLTFSKKFARAMVKLSQVEVKTGNEGEIRRVCNRIN